MSDNVEDSGSAQPSGVEDLLDEIDSILEKNAEEFVEAYVGKGAQGVTDYLSPQFFTDIVATAVAGNAAYDSLKWVLRSGIRALRAKLKPHSDTPQRLKLEDVLELPEGSIWVITNPDGSFRDPHDEELLNRYFVAVARILSDDSPRHDIQEADAFHAVMFIRHLRARTGWVQLPMKQAKILHAAGERRKGAKLTAAQMAADIIGEWLGRNPKAGKGTFEL
jgi:ubiquitin-like protein Pup